MNTISQTLETKLTTFATSLYALNNEAKDLDLYYFASGASTAVSALATNGTAATVSTALTKVEVVNGITLAEALVSFFGNSAVSTASYIDHAYNLINGNNPAGAVVTADVEQVGVRLVALANDCVELRKQTVDILKIYNSSELSAILGSMSAHTVVYGCSTTQSKLLAGVVLITQFQNMMMNASVTTGDYFSTVVKWAQGA